MACARSSQLSRLRDEARMQDTAREAQKIQVRRHTGHWWEDMQDTGDKTFRTLDEIQNPAGET